MRRAALYPAVACLGLLRPGPAPGAETAPAMPDTHQWVCQFCPWPLGWRGFIDAGPVWVSDTSSSFANYRGSDEEGGYLALGGQLNYLDESGRYIDVYASDLGLDSRRLEARGGRRGRYQLRLNWSEIPTYRGFGAQTPFLGVGGSELALPGGWVPADRTGDMTALPEALAPAPLRTRRRTVDLGFTLNFSSRWKWEVDMQRSRKDGTRAFSGGVLTLNASHFPAPVDFTTDRVDLGVSYAGERSSFQAALAGESPDQILLQQHAGATRVGSELP